MKPDLVAFVPSRNSPINEVAAIMHRVGRQMPKIGANKRFVEYYKLVVRKFFPQICDADVPSLEEHLQRYNKNRAKYFHDLNDNLVVVEAADADGMLKDEGYDCPKVPRAIIHPSDVHQTVLMSIQNAVDHAVFSLPWFVKGRNPRDWPRLLLDLFGSNPVIESDYRCMEAHHRGLYSEVLNFWVMHVIRNLNITNHFRRLFSRIVKGTNSIRMKYIKAQLKERLLSGSMWTSSANSVLNFLLMSFMSLESKYSHLSVQDMVDHLHEFRGVFEGDDGLTADTGFDVCDFPDLGLDMKFERRENFGKAHFCQIVCDLDTLCVVPDPVRVLRNFFILPVKYLHSKKSTHESLLRAKALSYKYLFNNTPIVGALCQMQCDRTRGYDVTGVLSEINQQKRDFVVLANQEKLWTQTPKVEQSTRQVVEEIFGIPINLQHEIEAKLQKGDLNIDLSVFSTPEMNVYSDRFVKFFDELIEVDTPSHLKIGDLMSRLKNSKMVKTKFKIVNQYQRDF